MSKRGLKNIKHYFSNFLEDKTPEDFIILGDLLLWILLHHQPHLLIFILKTNILNVTIPHLSIVVDVGDINRPVVVQDVKDHIVRRIQEVTNIDGGPTVQQYHVFHTLMWHHLTNLV